MSIIHQDTPLSVAVSCPFIFRFPTLSSHVYGTSRYASISGHELPLYIQVSCPVCTCFMIHPDTPPSVAVSCPFIFRFPTLSAHVYDTSRYASISGRELPLYIRVSYPVFTSLWYIKIRLHQWPWAAPLYSGFLACLHMSMIHPDAPLSVTVNCPFIFRFPTLSSHVYDTSRCASISDSELPLYTRVSYTVCICP